MCNDNAELNHYTDDIITFLIMLIWTITDLILSDITFDTPANVYALAFFNDLVYYVGD